MNLVIAGNYKQYLSYIQKNNLEGKEYKYITSYINILGYIDLDIVLTGEWWDSPVVKEIGLDQLCSICRMSKSPPVHIQVNINFSKPIYSEKFELE